MTTYTTITNALVAVGAKPFATTIQALRDNPIAIAEGDASVPAVLLPKVLLGTLTTTSGSSQTLSGLDLTPYKFLILTFNGVGHNSASVNKGVFITSTSTTSLFSLPNTSDTGTGLLLIDLATGIYSGSFGGMAAGNNPTGGSSGLSTASTSVTITVGVNTFDAGSIRIYGVK